MYEGKRVQIMSEIKSTSMRLQEIEAQKKALAEEETKLLAESKDADLDTVKRLCKQHGFTATNLRGFLAVKGKKKTTTATKPAKKTAAKKVTKNK